ncbi:MAG: hypothetical protein V9F01_11345 [Chitinophagaceae bacterium]
MRTPICLLSALFLLSCNTNKKVEYGSVTGNVFWKYNDYLGNRPDAGSEIKLYNFSDRTIKFSTKADVRGDYKFDKIPTGQYLMLTISNNTEEDEFGTIAPLFKYDVFFDSIFQVNLKSQVGNLYEKANSFSGISLFKNSFSKEDYIRLAKDNRDSSNFYSKQIIMLLPDIIKRETEIHQGRLPKLAINIAYVKKDETEQIITDFGLTN